MTQVVDNLYITRELLICIVLILGFVIGYTVYSRFKVRLGGVIATPLLTVYIVEYPLSAFVFLAGAILSYIVTKIVVSSKLIYGRRLFYVSCIISVATMLLARLFFATPMIPYVSIIPGIIAYNAFEESESVEWFTRSFVIWLLCEFIPSLMLAYFFLRVIGT